MQPASPAPNAVTGPIDLMLGSSGMVLVVLLMLIVASFAVWVIWFLKIFQLGRLRSAQHRFEVETGKAVTAEQLLTLATRHPDAPGARVVNELGRRQRVAGPNIELLKSVAKRAIVAEQQRVSVLMPTLSSIASASPFIGLFGTVWGIMDAFLKIGVEKSASLPVVAPAIGEALIATAFGLVAAIPATIGFNYIDQRIQDLLGELDASSDGWVETVSADPPIALRPSQPPATFPKSS
jgi:biopolymer transport protein TolQ